MKKFILIMFVVLIVALQFPFYTIESSVATINLRMLFSVLQNTMSPQYYGTLLVYAIPFVGILVSVINLLIKKNIAVLPAILSVVGILYCGFIYFVTDNIGGSVNFGFVIELISYIMILTISVVSIRMKE